MNCKKIFLVCAAITAGLAAGAQSVSYHVVANDPDNCKKTMLYVDLFNADTYLGASIGCGLKVETMVGERLMPWAQCKFALLDAATHHVVSGYPTSAGGLKKQLTMDFGTAFYLMNRTVKKKVKIVLSSSSSGRHTYTRYIMVPAEVKKLLGFEGGVNINRRALQFDEDSHPYFHYKSTDGHIDSPIHNVGNSDGQPAGEYYKPLSMAKVFSVYAGIHYRKINSLTISTSGSKKSNNHVTDLYLDVMLAPAVVIKNVFDISGNEWVLSPQSGAIKHIGWRAGFAHHNSQKGSLQYGMEFGSRPGAVLGKKFTDNGGYLSVNAGFTLGSRKSITAKPHKTVDK